MRASSSSSGVTLRTWPLSLARLVGHAGDAVVFVAVVPGLDGAPGELARVALLVEEGHGGDVVDAFVAGAARRRCRRRRGRASSNRPKAASSGVCSLFADRAGAKGDWSKSGRAPARTSCVVGHVMPISVRQAAAQCAGNSVTSDRSRSQGGVVGTASPGRQEGERGRVSPRWRRPAHTKKVCSVC